jgi:hypothetical protein
MPRESSRSPAEWADLKARVLAELPTTRSPTQLGKMFGINKYTVNNWLRRDAQYAPKMRVTYTATQREQFAKMWRSGMKPSAIAEAMDISLTQAYYWSSLLRNYGKTRKPPQRTRTRATPPPQPPIGKPMTTFTFSSDALPEQVRSLLGLLIEGKLADLCFVATTREGDVMQGIWAHIDGIEHHPYTMTGAIETLKVDWMQGFVPTRAQLAADPQGDPNEPT